MDRSIIELKGWWVGTVTYMHKFGFGPADLKAELSAEAE